MFRKLVSKILIVTSQRNSTRNLSTKRSYYHCLGEEQLRPLTLGEISELAAQRYGERTAVVSCHQNKRMNFKDLLDEADRLAAGFLKLGYQKGDRIGLWAPNLIEWYISFVACARGGFVAVAMNPYYQALEVQQLIRKAKIKGLVCGDIFRKQNYYEALTTVCPEIPFSKPTKIFSEKLPSLRNIVMITDDNKPGTYKYSDILNMADEENITQIKKGQCQIKCDEACNIQFTSGTTGDPKAPVQSHFHIVNNGYYCGKRTELNKKHHIICLQNPLFHVFGTVVTLSAAINHGSTVVLPNDGYDPEKNLAAMSEERCTIIFGTPTMYVDLVDKQKKHNENICVELALTGGALCSPQLRKDITEVLKVKKVKSIYGLTEGIAAAFLSHENDTEYQTINTVGKVLDHLEAKVVDDAGNIVPSGVPGELHIRGYSSMMGYFEDEARTKQIIDSNGWLHTGDQFILTEDGYGEVVGRIKDMIIRGGENIYPKEIEDFLITHPDILEIQVIGISHSRLGEEVCAVIKTRNNRPITAEDVFHFCKGKLSNFKIPSTVKMIEAFPTTTSGKIQKHKVIEMFKKNTTS